MFKIRPNLVRRFICTQPCKPNICQNKKMIEQLVEQLEEQNKKLDSIHFNTGAMAWITLIVVAIKF